MVISMTMMHLSSRVMVAIAEEAERQGQLVVQEWVLDEAPVFLSPRLVTGAWQSIKSGFRGKGGKGAC